MKKIIIFLFIFVKVLYAQTSFISNIVDSENIIRGISLTEFDGNYYLVSTSMNIATTQNTHGLLQINDNGELINSSFIPGEFPFNVFKYEDRLWSLGYTTINDSVYYLLEERENDLSILRRYLYFTDLVDVNYVNQSCPNIGSNGEFIFAAIFDVGKDETLGYNFLVDLVSIPRGLDTLFHKQYYNSNWLYAAPKDFNYINKKYLSCGLDFPANEWATEIGVFDSLFNPLDTLIFNGMELPKIMHDNIIREKSPNEVIMSGRIWDEDTTGMGNSAYSIGFVCLDSLLNYEEIHIVYKNVDTMCHTAYFKSLDLAEDGSFFIGGTIGGNPNGVTRIVLSKIDSEYNTKWSYFYGGDKYYSLFCIEATTDGGCILSVIENGYNHDILLIKLNDQGLITSLNDPGDGFSVSPILISPNPGREQLRIDLGPQLGACKLELYDLGGKLIISQQIRGNANIIHTSALPYGTYVYKVFNAAGFAESGKWVKQ